MIKTKDSNIESLTYVDSNKTETPIIKAYMGGGLVFQKNTIRRNFTLYTNVDAKEQVEEIQELIKSIVALSYEQEYGYYYANAKVNNSNTSILFYSFYLNSFGAGGIELQVLNVGAAESTIFSIDTWNPYTIEYITNNLLDILNESNNYSFHYGSDVINIELL